jgi:tRNA(Ile)-lysidine synthase
MLTRLKSGKYIAAVSGGVDSVVLLNMLAKDQQLDLVVAHFDHVTRDNSAKDCEFVQKLAEKYNLPFEYTEGRLGLKASEASAREARYKFLRRTKDKYNATAIVTAHHQDDLIETMILNLMRGTSRKGMTSLGEHADIKRPLLTSTKQELINYAKANNLEWREDDTNLDPKYLRNWIRLNLTPKLSETERQKLLTMHQEFVNRNEEIDLIVHDLIGKNQLKLPKQVIVQADHQVAKELIATWLRLNNIQSFDQKIIERIVIDAKTLKPGKIIPVVGQATIEVSVGNLLLKP